MEHRVECHNMGLRENERLLRRENELPLIDMNDAPGIL